MSTPVIHGSVGFGRRPFYRGLSFEEVGMGRLVNAQQGDYGLHNATFIAKLPHSLPSAEEWHTESEVL
jgi:hypothetical protein